MESIEKKVKPEFMPIDEIEKNVLSQYNFKVISINNIKFKDTEKQRAVYSIETDKGSKCLKKIFYNESNLLFIYSVIEWLNVKGVNCPRLLSTKKGLKYVNYNGNIFIVTDWIDGRKCNYDDINDVLIAAQTLGKIHKSSKNFKPIEGSYNRRASTDYYTSFSKHFTQLLELSNKAFTIKDSFSKVYLDNFDYNLQKARESLYLLSQINFSKLIGDEVSNEAICHLDYVNKNLIFTPENKIFVIDFDNTQIDMPIHDIANFLRRIMRRKNTCWDFDIFKSAIESYELVRPLSYQEHIAILSILMFPQKFWKISRDYYKNRNKCNHESFINILKKHTHQQKYHEIFCSNVQEYIEEKFKE